MIAEVTEHVNATHRADLRTIARANGAASAQDAELVGFNLAGLDLHAQIDNRLEPLRVNFDAPAMHPSDIEDKFMETLAAARSQLGMPPEETVTRDLEGSGSHDLPHAPEVVFAALQVVADYPAWLPPVGRIIEVSEPITLGSSFTIHPRGRDGTTMKLIVTALESNTALELLEDGGHMHRLWFSLEKLENGTRLTVTVGNRVPVPESELEETRVKLGTLGAIIAKKLEAHLKR